MLFKIWEDKEDKNKCKKMGIWGFRYIHSILGDCNRLNNSIMNDLL